MDTIVKHKNGTVETIVAGKVRWAVEQALNGVDIESALAQVKANMSTALAAHAEYKQALNRIATAHRPAWMGEQ